MLLRVGIDKGTDGVLAPIFSDGSFEYIPLSEKNEKTVETRTFKNTRGRNGSHFSDYVPERIQNLKMHFDPEFETYTYGDQTVKRNYLLKLEKNDLLIFYAGLTPHRNSEYEEALYIIGYFSVRSVSDFNKLNEVEIQKKCELFHNNSHIKFGGLENLVVVEGDPNTSNLLKKAVLISEKKLNKIGRNYHTVSQKMEDLLGISGSIQRSIPPRYVTKENNLINLKNILNME